MKIFTFLGRRVLYVSAILCDFINALVDALTKQKGFNAEFGKETDIASRFNRGFVISKHRRLSRLDSYANMIVTAPSGAGKTVRIILPNIFEIKNASMIISDPAMQIFMLASGYLSKFFTIKSLNFSDVASSCGFNVFSFIKKPNDVSRIASLLAANLEGPGNSDPFWQIQSINTLEIIIQLILYQPVEYHNMANVVQCLHLLSAEPKKIDTLIAKTNDDALILRYKSLISNSERTLQSILSSAKAATRIFEDVQISKITSHNSIKFAEFRKKPTILFLHNSIADQKYVRILSSLFFEAFYGHILQGLPEKNDLDIFCIMEELSSFSKIPILPLALANCRKTRTSTLAVIQCKSQLTNLYREDADTIISNCLTRLYLPGITEMDVLREIENLSGKCIYKDEKGIERVKPLIEMDAIRLLPKNRSLIISGNNAIIKGRTRPYFKSHTYRKYSQIPPVSLKGDIPDEPIPMLT